MKERDFYHPIFRMSQSVTVCELEDGTRVEYDACGEHVEDYDSEKFTLIGSGHIYSVNGVVQSYTKEDKMFFFRYA